jgi:murein DD-endopeptidase MepM/ murein hydrolase activator NlpD
MTPLSATRRPAVLAICSIVVMASIFPVDLFPGALHGQHGTDGQLSGKQGQVLLVNVPTAGAPAEIAGRFLGRRVPFSHAGAGAVGLLGIDMQDAPGTHELTIELTDAKGPRRLSYHVLVVKEKYPKQHLTLPKDKVDLDEEGLVRVKAEQEQVKTVLDQVSVQRLWEGPFVEPVHGSVSGAFGRVRIINGQSKNPHSGEDIAAPLGTEVVAMNDGIARLTVDHFFSGKGVFVDHGLGLYSMYFHLSEVLVQDGARVTRGQVIGKVGASGRATGPHLHWGVRLNGARVNPYSLLTLPLTEPLAARQ